MVGYACSIRLSWLNEAVRMLKENLPEAEYKEKMNEYLSYEIDSPTRLRKTREILMNVWYYPSEELDPVRKDALEVLAEHPDCSEPVQYLMLCLTYPVFKDVCKIMGKLFEFQDEITNPALKQKDILRNETKTRYVLHKIPITNDKVLDFVIAQGMKLDGSSYYSYTELDHLNILFPFEYSVKKELLMQSEKYTMSGFGGEVAFSLKG